MDDVLSTRLDLLEARLTFWLKREAELETSYMAQLARFTAANVLAALRLFLAQCGTDACIGAFLLEVVSLKTYQPLSAFSERRLLDVAFEPARPSSMCCPPGRSGQGQSGLCAATRGVRLNRVL